VNLVGIMGDVHGNTRHTVAAIARMCELLPEPRIILQAGDFGVYPETGTFEWAGEIVHVQTFLEAVEEVLKAGNAELWFVDGNHEDHHLLRRHQQLVSDFGVPYGNPVRLAPSHHITWLPRGYRWEWHGRTWLALGGAVSVDKLLRTEGKDWFPEEAITDEQEAAVIAGGPADIMLTHDAPVDAPLRLIRPAPVAWQPMIPAADAHRERMQRICEAVKPSWLFHGHYHQEGASVVQTAWGRCEFTALHMDGCQHNWGVLDLVTMKWTWDHQW
jgi:hypothetical protein